MKAKMFVGFLAVLVLSICIVSCEAPGTEEVFINGTAIKGTESLSIIATDTVEVAASCLVSGSYSSCRYEQIDLLFSNGRSFQLYRYVNDWNSAKWSKKITSYDPFFAKETHVCVIGYNSNTDVFFIENLTVKGRIKK